MIVKLLSGVLEFMYRVLCTVAQTFSCVIFFLSYIQSCLRQSEVQATPGYTKP